MTAERKAFWVERCKYEPKTNSTMYALNSVAQHWVENEILIEKAANEQVELHGPKWRPAGQEEVGEFLFERDMVRQLHDEILIPMHRYACIVMLCTTVERELKRLVENLEMQNGKQKLTIGDIRGSNLSKVAKYVEAFFGVLFVECPQYQAINDLHKIRHCIVHCLGEVGRSDDRNYLVKLNDKRKGFFACEGRDIDIEAECIRQFITETWEFFVWIFNRLTWSIDSCYQGNALDKHFKKLPSV